MRASRCIPGVLPWGYYLAVSNRAHSGWQLNRFSRVKRSMYNAWSSAGGSRGSHLTLIFPLGRI